MTRRPSVTTPGGLAAVCALTLAACSPASPAHPTSSATPTARPSPTTQPPSSSARASLATCPAPQAFGSLPVLARMSGADDLATAPDGSLWVSDAASHLEHLSAAGSVLARLTDPRAPEGMVPLADGRILLAEQGPDRIVVLQPSSGQETTLLQLTARAGQLGVDGIAWDATTGNLLVPDSPNGTLLAVALGSGATTRLATGLGRPVDAAVVPGGGVAVTAENTAGLLVVPAAGGTGTQLGALSDTDDVVSAGGLLYVTLLGAGQVRAVDPSTGASTALVTGVNAPQGLTLLAGGGLAIGDSTTGVIATLPLC